ncbi:hypothetical protein GCM10009754_10640 [Amycolatopsis minnesotensis]|uniref:Uncharacterized protein n=1 Tax=Amycolatopsis minnesotensis TaxID=337894 RepID=A0ABP5BIJ9_9PSEU
MRAMLYAMPTNPATPPEDDGPPPSLRVATRWFAGDWLPHLYLVGELGDETINFLQPPAHTSPYRDFHPRSQLSTKQLKAPAALWDTCPTCDRWLRRNRYSVLLQGEVRT